MNWLNTIANEIEQRHPDGEIVVSSGVSPSGVYHLGTLREVMTAEIIARELRTRGRTVRHIHVVDDLDVYRKVPAGIPESYKQYLGWPLSDIPSPDGTADMSYADYYLQDLLLVADTLHMDIEIVRAHKQYRQGAYVESIEKALLGRDAIKAILEEISGRSLDESWTPVQVVEDGYLKSRVITAVDTGTTTVTYIDRDGNERQADYSKGEVKMDWRIDWPARWWHFGVQAEPFGRDHATKGGSYDTGARIVAEVYGSQPPLPMPYNFVNRTGDTKKMSKSSGDTITAAELTRMLPSEVIWFFLMRYAPEKTLFFDEGATLMRLIDEFGELLAKPDRTEQEEQLLRLCMLGVQEQTVSRVPFTLLISSYQAALQDPARTLQIISRTEYADVAEADAGIITRELGFLDEWLAKRAPEEVRFSLAETIDGSRFSQTERDFMAGLADVIAKAPADADGAWFHDAIYAFKESSGLTPKELFTTLYRATIDKDRGPRAGWFLSILPRDWLVARLRLQA